MRAAEQTVSAAFAEMAAPVLDNLEIDAAGRVDHYNSSAGTAFTPKLGFKWTVIPQFAVRGTFARGFPRPGHRGERPCGLRFQRRARTR